MLCYSKPELPVQTYLRDKMEEVRARELAAAASISTAEMVPSVGADAFVLRETRELAAKAPLPGVRNTFNLAPSMDAPKTKSDTWMIDWAKTTKQTATRGAIKKDWIGVKGSPIKEDIYANFAKEAQAFIPPRGHVNAWGAKNKEAFQGIKPNTTADDYVLSQYKAERQRIKEAEMLHPVVRPEVPHDDFMIEHAKSLAEVNKSPPKRTRWPFAAGRSLRPGEERPESARS